MGSLVDNLIKREMVTPPPFIKNTVQYEVLMGSVAYGVKSKDSDYDVYGFCIPPKHIIFPHLNGEILGFGRQNKRFDQWQQQHIKETNNKLQYDITIYNIVRYFHLCMENNPNIIDSLFVPRRCVLHSTQVGNLVRENRKLFLHKGAWFKFKGYAYSQVHKMKSKDPAPDSNRYEMIEKFGYDVKFAYHVVRLLNEIEQILIENDLDLERNNEQLKSIRRGEWTEDQIVEYFEKKEKELEPLYTNSKLQHSPDEDKIKALLLECLEMHYGSLDNAINKNISVEKIIFDMSNYLDKLARELKK